MTKNSRSNPKKEHLPHTSPDVKETNGTPRRLPFWQTLLLPIAAILIFALILEGGLTLFGIGSSQKTEDPFVGFSSNAPLFVPAPGGQLTTASNKLNYFNAQSFPESKPPGSYRIFCLGGSTTYGRPYNDVTSFPGWLRELLPVADQGKNWEVINAGGISYASYRVAHLMEELINYQPDLFIIYTGHNEFLEERTYSQIKKLPAVVRTTVSLLAKTRTWTAMSSVLQGLGLQVKPEGQKRDRLSAEVDAILDRSAGPSRYSRDDQLQENIAQHYRISLERMVDLAHSVGAKVIFVTPASNLKDCSPFKSQHTEGLEVSAQHQSEELLSAAREMIGREDWGGALSSLDAALAIDPRDAELSYRRGQVLLALGRVGDAEQSFIRARDEDVCPLRALTPLRQVLVEVAREQTVPLVDYMALLQKRMQQEQGVPIPGQEYFLDHVHPTIEGNQILSVALIQEMISEGLVKPDAGWGEAAIARVAGKVEGRIDPKTHGQALANLARVLLWAGKNEEAARLANQALEIAGGYPQVATDANSILISVLQRQGNLQGSVDLLYAALVKEPGSVELHLKLGQALISPPFNRPEEAAANLLLVCKLLPELPSGYEFFGMAMAKRGRLDLAFSGLSEALRLSPNEAKARQTLAQVNQMLGGQTLNPTPPQITLDSYPSRAPRKLLQVRPGADGRPIPDGIEVEFFENGRVSRFQDYQQGLKDGLELTWDDKGQLLSQVLYDRGIPVKNQGSPVAPGGQSAKSRPSPSNKD